MQNHFFEKTMTPFEVFIDISKSLLKHRKLYCAKYEFSTKYNEEQISAFNKVWEHKHGYKNNIKMQWGDWLIDCVFPRYLYKESQESLLNLLQDKRFFDDPSFFKKSTCHSHMGRMSRPRKTTKDSKYVGFLDYTIDRWKRDNHKSMPHFYFDVESPEWIYEELIRNPNQIKSGRTATSCTANFAFRYDRKTNMLYFTQIGKHFQYSHIFGDIFGISYFANAFAKEVGIPKENVRCCIFAISISMDGMSQAKEIFNYIGI